MRYRLTIVLFLFALHASAQFHDEVLSEKISKVKGFVLTMKVRSHMVRMVEDSLVYGEDLGNHTYTFDDDGKIVSEMSITEFNHDTSYSSYNYNDAHLLTSKHNKAKHVATDLIYTYTDDKILSVKYVDAKGVTSSSATYVYGGDSIIVHQTYIARKPVSFKNVYRHDAQTGNTLFFKAYYEDGSAGGSTKYEYDEFNNPVLKKTYDKDGKVVYTFTYEYIYDVHHNFTKCSEYRNGKIYSITTREIIYQ